MALCNAVCAVPRALVSQNKRRFRDGGFDLDLCYVHPRVIVMGYPASGLESMFRNPRGEVQRLLEERHAGRYFVYNFCDEPRRSYPASAFDGRVQRFPIEDHNVPTLQQATAFCEHAATWLAGDDQRVVALHCKAGKGRAGMMACMLLVRLGFVGTADEAIECYNSVRVRDRLGLTVTSQKKWVRYYASLWSSTAVPQASPAIAEPTLMIDQLALRNTLTGTEPPELRLRVFQLDPATSRKTLVFQSLGHDEFPVEKQVRGSVQIEFHRVGYGDCRPVKHFKVWINTLLVATDLETRRRVVVPRADMDWVRRDRKMQRFPAAFELELLLAAPGEGPRAAEVVQPPHE